MSKEFFKQYLFSILCKYSRHICNTVFSSSQTTVDRFSRRLLPRESSNSHTSLEGCFSSVSFPSSSADSSKLSSSFLYIKNPKLSYIHINVQNTANLRYMTSITRWISVIISSLNHNHPVSCSMLEASSE